MKHANWKAMLLEDASAKISLTKLCERQTEAAKLDAAIAANMRELMYGW